MAEPTQALLSPLFGQGHARLPGASKLMGPATAGLWWQTTEHEVVATPLLLRQAANLASDGERVGLLLATEPRFRDRWLAVMAHRLAELGRRDSIEDLCRQIGALGPAAGAVQDRLSRDRVGPTSDATLELSLFGAPADQPAAAPGLLRVLGATSALIEGGQGQAAQILPPVDPRDPSINWIAGRLLQTPNSEVSGGTAVLRGAVRRCPVDSTERMAWALETPWVTLLSVLGFTAEAWAAERQGGLQLELPAQFVQSFAHPTLIEVVVTLADGQEILCGSLGELCLRTLDALGMAIVPTIDAAALDQQLGGVVAELLKAGVWCFRPEGRTRYYIGTDFGYDCYRGAGHRHIFLGADELSHSLREVAVGWAKARSERPNPVPT